MDKNQEFSRKLKVIYDIINFIAKEDTENMRTTKGGDRLRPDAGKGGKRYG